MPRRTKETVQDLPNRRDHDVAIPHRPRDCAAYYKRYAYAQSLAKSAGTIHQESRVVALPYRTVRTTTGYRKKIAGQRCSVVVISIYIEDVACFQLLIAQIPDHAICRDLASVRTTEEAIGGEADIVITTLPRSAKVDSRQKSRASTSHSHVPRCFKLLF